MKMKIAGLLVNTLIFIFAAFLFCANTSAQVGEGNLRLTPAKKKESLYFVEAEKILKKRNAVFNLDVDIQFGLGISNTNIDLNKVDSNTQSLQNTDTKTGPSIGAIVNLDFIGFGFTTGFQYSSKGFETVGGTKTAINYINIPLLLYLGYETGKVRIDGNIGPYFGLLLSQDETTYFAVKNFDLGLTANISGAYMFHKYIGALLGLKYEYGGLNNLLSNEYVSKTTSSTIFIYTGLKFEI